MSPDEFLVLLIDDDEDDYINIRDLFKEIRSRKYTLVWKSNYEEGLKAAAEQKFDVCLLDYRLGAHTGLDFLNEIRSFELNFPIILLTGQDDFDLDVKAMQIGAADYLTKDLLTAPLLERAIRYSMKHALDMNELKENKALIMQQDRLASLGLLASSLAHEIGTPLGIIRSRAEMVQKKSTEKPTQESMETIVVQIDRITKLVNSLLHLAREKKSEFAAPVNLNSVVQDVVNLMQHEFNRKSIALKIDINDVDVVKAEPGPLGQVLLNLLINSIHAIDEAKKQSSALDHLVRVSTRPTSTGIDLVVCDTGSGIPPHYLNQLFKPFFTTKDIGAGTGLGLATSFKLVQSWGGTITANNNPDRGASFTVSLLKP